jgi:hypothetical protein
MKINVNKILPYLILSLFFAFRQTLLLKYNEIIVTPILSNIQSDIPNDIYFLLLNLSIIFLILYLAYSRKYLFPNKYIILLLLLSFILYYFRFQTKDYIFTPYCIVPALKYFDTVFILLGGFALLITFQLLRNKSKVLIEIPRQNGLNPDDPIQNSAKDKFDRYSQALQIARKIEILQSSHKMGAFAIGISGSWGFGKTSFLNLIKSAIKNDNQIFLDFNPWRSPSSQRIADDFFDQLEAVLSEYGPKIPKQISKYAKTIKESDSNLISNLLFAITEMISPSIDKNEVYSETNKLLKKLEKGVVVFIDDLDRLDTSETIDVLKLIRNTANFSNFTYVVCYDKLFMENAIKEFNTHNYWNFHEKIFQFEFILPPIDDYLLRQELKNLICREIDIKYHEEIKLAIDSTEVYSTFLTNKILKNYRDVIRFSNSFISDITPVINEIDIEDFFKLQLIKLKHPKLWVDLYDLRSAFFKLSDNSLYRLRKVNEKSEDDEDYQLNFILKAGNNPSSNKEPKSENSFLQQHLINNRTHYSLSEYEANIVFKVIRSIMEPRKPIASFVSSTNPNFEINQKTAADSKNFYKYFALRVYAGDIAVEIFEDMRRKDYNTYKQAALTWIEKGKKELLISRLVNVNDFATRHEFENHINILFDIGRLETKDRTKNPHWIDSSLLIKYLKFPLSHGNKAVIFDNQQAYKEWILFKINNGATPKIFESLLLGRLVAAREFLCFTPEEISEINLNIFKEFCYNNSIISDEFYFLYHNCIVTDDSTSSGYSKNKQAIELFKEYISKNIKPEELSSYIRQTNPNSQYYFLDKEWLNETFGSIENLKSLIDKKFVSSSKHVIEFNEFLTSFNANDQSPVKFDFKVLNVVKFS